MYDPSGDFARGSLIPLQQVRATAKMGNWPDGITFADGQNVYRVTGAAEAPQCLELVTAADDCAGASISPTKGHGNGMGRLVVRAVVGGGVK